MSKSRSGSPTSSPKKQVDNAQPSTPSFIDRIDNQLVALQQAKENLHTAVAAASTGGESFGHKDRAQLVYNALWQEIQKINPDDYAFVEDLIKAYNDLKDPKKLKEVLSAYMVANHDEIVKEHKFGRKVFGNTWSTVTYKALEDFYGTRKQEITFDVDAFLSDLQMILDTYIENVFNPLIGLYKAIALQEFHLSRAKILSIYVPPRPEAKKAYFEMAAQVLDQAKQIEGMMHANMDGQEIKDCYLNILEKQATDKKSLEKQIQQSLDHEVNIIIAEGGIRKDQLEKDINHFKKNINDLDGLVAEFCANPQSEVNRSALLSLINDAKESMQLQHSELTTNLNLAMHPISRTYSLKDYMIENIGAIKEISTAISNIETLTHAGLNANAINKALANLTSDNMLNSTDARDEVEAFAKLQKDFSSLKKSSSQLIEKWRTSHFREKGACPEIRKIWKTVSASQLDEKYSVRVGAIPILPESNPFPPTQQEIELTNSSQKKVGINEKVLTLDNLIADSFEAQETKKANELADLNNKQNEILIALNKVEECRTKLINLKKKCLEELKILNKNVIVSKEVGTAKDSLLKELQVMKDDLADFNCKEQMAKLSRLEEQVKGVKIQEPIVQAEMPLPEPAVQVVPQPALSFWQRHKGALIGSGAGFGAGLTMFVVGLVLSPWTGFTSLSLSMVGFYLMVTSPAPILLGGSAGAAADYLGKKNEQAAVVAPPAAPIVGRTNSAVLQARLSQQPTVVSGGPSQAPSSPQPESNANQQSNAYGEVGNLARQSLLVKASSCPDFAKSGPLAIPAGLEVRSSIRLSQSQE